MTPGVLDGSTKWNAAPGLPKQPTPRIAMWTNGLDLGPKMKVWNHMWFLFLRGDDFGRLDFPYLPGHIALDLLKRKKAHEVCLVLQQLLRSICNSTWERSITYPSNEHFWIDDFSRYCPVWWVPFGSVFLELFSTHHSPGWLGSQGAMVFQLGSGFLGDSFLGWNWCKVHPGKLTLWSPKHEAYDFGSDDLWTFSKGWWIQVPVVGLMGK